LSDAKYFDDSTTKFQEIRVLLDSKEHKDKLEALKRLLAMMTMGKDVSMFFPDVVKNVIVPSIEMKKLVYMFLIHYSETNQDLALLSINTFQRDLQPTSPPRIRANAICAMASIRVPAVVPLIVLALKQTIRDSSSYVRRSAAQSIPQIYFLDREGQYEPCCDMIIELLTTIDPAVLPSAIYAFNNVCPNRWDIIHPHFRKLCHLLADFDPISQAMTLKVLIGYARAHFPLPPGYFPLEHTPPPATLLSQGIQPISKNDQTGTISLEDLTTTAAKLLSGSSENNTSYSSGPGNGVSKVTTVLAKFKQASGAAFYDDDDDDERGGKGKKKKGTKKGVVMQANKGDNIDRFSTFDDDGDDFFGSKKPTTFSQKTPQKTPPTKQQQQQQQSPEVTTPTITSDDNKQQSPQVQSQPQQQPQQPQQPQIKPIDLDLALLLKTAANLLHTQSTAVIIEIAALYQAFAPTSLYSSLITALVRMSRNTRTQSFLLLTTISTFATRVPQMMTQYIPDFFIAQTDPIYIRSLKLEILNALLLTPEDANIMFKEMTQLCRMPEKDVVCKAMEILCKICLLVPNLCGVTLRILFALLESPNDAVTVYASASMRLLLQRHSNDIPLVVLKKLCHLLVTKIEEPLTRSTIIWLIGEHCAKVPQHSSEILRQCACTFVDEHSSTRLQILNLAVRAYLVLPTEQPVALLFKYIMDLCKYDMDLDIRDKSRFYRAIFFRKKPTQNPDLTPEEQQNEELITILPQEAKDQLRTILLQPRPPTENLALTTIRDHYQFGTISHALTRKVSGYAPLCVPPIDTLNFTERENLPVQQQQPQPFSPVQGNRAAQVGPVAGGSPVIAKGKKQTVLANNKKHFDSFYDSDDDDDDDDDDDEEDEDEEEDEEEKDDDHDDDDDEEEDEEDEDEDEDEEEEEEEEEEETQRSQRNTDDAFALLQGNNNNTGGFFDF
jgi:vesicle coat complex subunit